LVVRSPRSVVALAVVSVPLTIESDRPVADARSVPVAPGMILMLAAAPCLTVSSWSWLPPVTDATTPLLDSALIALATSIASTVPPLLVTLTVCAAPPSIWSCIVHVCPTGIA
jgi:hypothetical protein